MGARKAARGRLTHALRQRVVEGGEPLEPEGLRDQGASALYLQADLFPRAPRDGRCHNFVTVFRCGRVARGICPPVVRVSSIRKIKYNCFQTLEEEGHNDSVIASPLRLRSAALLVRQILPSVRAKSLQRLSM